MVIGSRGDSKECFFVLTERITNLEVIEPLKSRSAKEVVKALDRIEREIGEKKFRNIFKTITFDNGVEFSDVENIERSRRNKKREQKHFFVIRIAVGNVVQMKIRINLYDVSTQKEQK